MVKLAFFKAEYGNFFDKLVAWGTRDNFLKIWTSGRYSHVEIVVSENDSTWVGFSSFFREGVRLKTFQKNHKWDFLVIEGITLDSIEKFYCKHKCKKYDLIGAFIIFPLRIKKSNNPGKYFCSELVAQYLKESGYNLTKHPSRIDPNALFSMLNNTRLNRDS